ncbi:protein kinase [Nonomuraea sp. NPDC048916]|uniref:serine/threonine-protein kinase n=1 Tax=Nonomuraea sp. NPDC048916 TaxID=3154232 RepID=UPI00340CEF5D
MAADRVLSGPGAEGNASQSQGRLIGRRYRLMSPVGRGGMGMVWHAHDVLLDRAVAVKELILPFGLDNTGKQIAHRRMLREARSAARLTHPGIVTVHDVVEEDGRPWIVMELVRAWSLEQAVRQSGPLPVIQAAEIGIRVLDALRHAHAAGILHRDIKPGNVLLTADRVVLTDFGIAAIEGDVTITQTGLLMGSPAYIPPERLSGQPITQAADLWSFGATLYAAVEGRPPYEGPDAIAVLGAVLTQDPTRPQRAGALLPIIERLLRKNPAERLTAEQVSEALERVLHAHGSVRPRTPETQPSLPTQADSTPMALLPPFDASSGPMPSRIVETPSGPVRVPYDPASGPPDTPDAMSSPSGGQFPPPPRPDGFDAFTSHSGPLRAPESPSGPLRLPEPPAGARPPFGGPAGAGDPAMPPFGGPSGPHPTLEPRELGDPSGPHPVPNPPRELGAPSGSHPIPNPPREFGGPSGPHPVQSPPPGPGGPGGPTGPHSVPDRPAGPQPILPLTTDSRAVPWPLATDDDLRDHSRALSRDVPRSRLAARPSVPDRTTRSRRRPEAGGGNAWMRDGRPTARLILASVAAVGTVAVAIALVASSRSPEPVVSTPLASASASAQPLQAAVPDGYTKHTPPGFSAAVPDGWKLTASAGEATFTGPKDSGLRILVEQTTPQPDGGLSELGREEADGGREGYIQVQLQATQFRTWKAADWEYTYTLPNGVPMHALTRYVTIDDDTAYKITFDMPELTWDDQAKSRKVFLDTFRQTT